MSNLRYVGLDVHKDSIVMAVAESDSSPAMLVGRLEWSESGVLKALRKLGPLSSLKVCFEAGPTGYGLQRYLAEKKVNCVVVAPSLIPRGQGNRIKTDRRDALMLAQFLRSGNLTSVWVPDEQTEAIRDLVRSRDDARLDERRIKQQLLKFLLRQGRRCPTKMTHWTKAHWGWIRQQTFEHEAQQRVLADAVQTCEKASARIALLDQDIAQCMEGWTLAPLVKNLQAFRGIKLITAAGLASEIGDFTRFPRAEKLMAFVGLVPSENSSGGSRRLGGITKAGNRHVRRLLIEAAWQYVGAPATMSRRLAERRQGVPEEVVEIANRALRRLRRKSNSLMMRKKTSTKIAAAIARELTGFIWAAGLATAGLRKPTEATTAWASRVTSNQSSSSKSTNDKQSRANPRRIAAGATR